MKEFVAQFAEYARKIPAGRWITNVTWDHERWPGAPLPTREWIDAAAGDHPVFIPRLDGHMALANTRALAIAGIHREMKDPEGGSMVRDPSTGEPTGVAGLRNLLESRHQLQHLDGQAFVAGGPEILGVRDLDARGQFGPGGVRARLGLPGVGSRLPHSGKVCIKVYFVSPTLDGSRLGEAPLA